MNNLLIAPLHLASFLLSPSAFSEEGFRSLFNGKDLTGWDGNPELWSVEDGCITGKTTGPEQLPYNQFLIWRGGVVKNFELRAKDQAMRQQHGHPVSQQGTPEYRQVVRSAAISATFIPRLRTTRWSMRRKGRGILVQNGQSVVIDPEGKRVAGRGARTGDRSISPSGTTTRSSRREIISFTRSTAR